MGQVESCKNCVSAGQSSPDASKPIIPDKAPARSSSQQLLWANLSKQMKEKFKSQSAVRARLDTNGDKLIDKTEFRRFMNKELAFFDAESLEKLFKEIDDNGDGYITVEEFIVHFCLTRDDKENQAPRKRERKSSKVNFQTNLSTAEKDEMTDTKPLKQASQPDLSGQCPKEEVLSRQSSKASVSTHVPSRQSSKTSVSTDVPPKKRRSDSRRALPDFKAFVRQHFGDPQSAFAKFDVNDDKSLALSEFAVILEGMNYPGSIAQLFAEIDDNKDGDITWEEFKSAVRGITFRQEYKSAVGS